MQNHNHHHGHNREPAPARETTGELITIQNGEPLADSRVIAAGLGIERHNFLATVDKYKPKLENKLGVVLEGTEQPRGPLGGRPARYVLLTKRQFNFVATLSRNTGAVVDFKLALVEAFEAAEEALEAARSAPKFKVPTTLTGALRLAADLNEENERIEKEKAQAIAKLHDATGMLEEAQPMVQAYEDFLSKAETERDWASAAKEFDDDGQRLGGVRLCKLLRAEGILIDGGRGHNTPLQKYIERGYFRVYSNHEYRSAVTVVKPKGMAFLSRVLAKIRARAPHGCSAICRRPPPQPAQPPVFLAVPGRAERPFLPPYLSQPPSFPARETPDGPK